MYASAVKFKKEPIVSRIAGPKNNSLLALFFSCVAAATESVYS